MKKILDYLKRKTPWINYWENIDNSHTRLIAAFTIGFIVGITYHYLVYIIVYGNS